MPQITPFRLIAEKLASGVSVCIDSPSCEEVAVLEKIMAEIAPMLSLGNVYTWDAALKFQQIAYTPNVGIEFKPANLQAKADTPHQALDFVRTYSGRAIFVFLDLHKIPNDALLQRLLKATSDALYQSKGDELRRLVLLGEGINLPRDFDGRIAKINLELPTPDEILTELKLQASMFVKSYDDVKLPQTDDQWLQIVRKASGLSFKEITNVVREVFATHRQIGEETAARLHLYKIQKLLELGVEVAEPPDTAIGGMNNLKSWLAQRAKLLTTTDKDVPRIKGILAVGSPGTGKSLLAKTAGQMLGVPVFKLQMDAIFGSLVGESEKNLRQILKMASASAPIVLWIDEIEKAFAGMSGDAHVGDSGVGRRVFGMLLTWMQENQESVFTVATANDTESLPPELLRKGRFDEIFRVDLPTTTERAEILRIHLDRWGKNTPVNVRQQLAAAISSITPEYSGAELAAVVEAAAIAAISADRKGVLEFDDLKAVCAETQPLAAQQRDKLDRLRATWAKFAPASTETETASSVNMGRGAGIVLPNPMSDNN